LPTYVPVTRTRTIDVHNTIDVTIAAIIGIENYLKKHVVFWRSAPKYVMFLNFDLDTTTWGGNNLLLVHLWGGKKYTRNDRAYHCLEAVRRALLASTVIPSVFAESCPEPLANAGDLVFEFPC
jgi:hypothetical protein